jgi:beta-lactamase class A
VGFREPVNNHNKMMARPCIVLLSFILSAAALCQSTRSSEQVRQHVQTILDNQKGIFALAFKDLSTGQQICINEHETFHAASTVKTPVMIEVFKQVAAGRLSLSDSIELKNEFNSLADGSIFKLDSNDDSEKELYAHLGSKRTLSALVYEMITKSSNLSTNLLVGLVGAKNAERTMRDMGLKEIRVLRGVEDTKAFEKGLNNTTTAYDLMLLYEKMARGETVSPTASQEMIAILLDQQFHSIIPANLPPTVKVAHKTGSFQGVEHDSGIVFLPDGRKYVLVILSKNLENSEEAVKAMATVSEILFKYLNP